MQRRKLLSPIKGEQRILESQGRFRERKNMGHAASLNGQIKKLSWPPELFSEALW